MLGNIPPTWRMSPIFVGQHFIFFFISFSWALYVQCFWPNCCVFLLVSPFRPMWLIKRKEEEKRIYRERLGSEQLQKKKEEKKLRAHFRAFAQQAGFVPGSKVKRSPIVLKF